MIAAWHGADEFITVGRPCGSHDFLVGFIKIPVADIIHDAGAVEPGLLEHHAKHGAQSVPGKIQDVVPVNEYAAAVQFIEPHKQVNEGGFPTPGRADDGNGLAGVDDRGKVMDDQLIGPVAKMHMGKLHIPPHLFRLYGRACLRHLLLLIQEFKHTLCRGSRGLECV